MRMASVDPGIPSVAEYAKVRAAFDAGLLEFKGQALTPELASRIQRRVDSLALIIPQLIDKKMEGDPRDG